MKKIVFTGGGSAGHVTPNLALIARLKPLGWQIDYIGSQGGIERDIIGREAIPYHPIASGKLRRYFDLRNAKDPFNVLKGTLQAYRLLRRLRPHIVFSKGGFVSVPVIVASRLCGIPVIAHESDFTPGLANKISMPFVSRLCVTFPETLEGAGDKAQCTGLPIREHIYRGKAIQGRSLCDFHSQKPVLLVMGGSLGAQKINQAIRGALEPLLERFQIAHICGKGMVDETKTGIRGYRQFEYVSEELPDLLASADLVVSRAGSTSIFEFLALRKPMLLIPLSRQASRGDQIWNAASFEKQGFCHVLQEEELTPESLVREAERAYRSREAMAERMAAAPYRDGTDAIIELIEQFRLR
ncbi:undecaprenyldiphospho-muramoylpentapeptide beta-N-acetylglucosaminyltransferase [Paenibacillus ginsengihumi]|uniref:undecaprenyldiphospho-muramoylpentapeptide beta-N-acetylglucosaminyltransferase n=1 Tax=Paenibacillus ginsengihumi TaxID=431596 RepID=UPI0003606266|nr:undecaprenyldiphospho-muramoylpentapeptide beta-N-acetylglucosaminyltransferase [Paenibacillus ginsengihumi]